MSRSNHFERVFIKHSQSVKHDGSSYQFDFPKLPALRDIQTGEILFDAETDSAISETLRLHLGLLSPSAIFSYRSKLGLTQKQLSEFLGIAAETISRWESGSVIQSKSSDRLLRLFFFVDDAKKYLGYQPSTSPSSDSARSLHEWSRDHPASWRALGHPRTHNDGGKHLRLAV